jgi:hypothetical protein
VHVHVQQPADLRVDLRGPRRELLAAANSSASGAWPRPLIVRRTSYGLPACSKTMRTSQSVNTPCVLMSCFFVRAASTP